MAFENLKKDIAESVVCAINEDAPFEVETDASDYAIAATLNQSGRPVAFFPVCYTVQRSAMHQLRRRPKPSSRQFATGGTILLVDTSL